jgi:nitrogen fixation/metabolism regulation signal transduction histidine kinase
MRLTSTNVKIMDIKNIVNGSPDFFQSLFNTVPSMVFVVDSERRILHWNEAAKQLLDTTDKEIVLKHHGEFINCINSTDGPGGCGNSNACETCVIKNSVDHSFEGNKTYRKITNMTLQSGSQNKEVQFLVSSVPFKFENSYLTLLIMEDITELIQLRGLLPICAWCKKIRNDKNYWESVEQYMHKQFDTDFTHGICPECVQKHHPDVYSELYGKKSGST